VLRVLLLPLPLLMVKPLLKGKPTQRGNHMLKEKANNPKFVSIIRHNEISDSWPGKYW
jgi:hypothetical protein